MTPSEQLVFDLCRRSFLSLWSYANPRRPDDRELCDVLVVFGEHVVVFSIKEISFNEDADPDVAAQRWVRKAVDASVDQLLGARRMLTSMNSVVRSDGSPGIDLPPLADRRVHLVAVAAGGKRAVPFAGGMKDGGSYVHAVDEVALREILGELDTAADFLHYLVSKEGFGGSVVCEGEENLLALYIHRGRKLPALHLLAVEDGLWTELQAKPEFLARKEADRVSYWWDDLIELLTADYQIEPDRGVKPSDHEKLVRVMAAENRFARRILSASCLDWLRAGRPGARNLLSKSGVGYVFSTYPRDWDRKRRTIDLEARCFVARSPTVMNRETIIGLATEVYDPAGYSVDAAYLHLPDWTTEDDARASEARSIFGILESPTIRRLSANEFPTTVPGSRSRSERNRKKRDRRSRR